MAVALDVIKQIRIRRYSLTRRAYCKLTAAKGKRLSVDSQLQGQWPQIKRCNVCGIGSTFMSTIRLDNSFKIDFMDTTLRGASLNEDQIRKRLRRHFSAHQLDLIEVAFMCDVGFAGSNQDSEHPLTRDCPLANEAERYGKQFPAQRDRLIAIMQNIVENRGTFVLPQPKRREQ
jgi:hypothetical protein